MLDGLVKRVIEVYPGVGQFRAILALRGGDPFAPHELARLIVNEPSFTERLNASWLGAASMKPRRRPLTARDMMDNWGYRAVHCAVVGNAICDILGPSLRGRELAPFWRWTFISAGYTAIMCETLRRHEDEAYAGAFLRHAALALFRNFEPEHAAQARDHAVCRGLTLWEAERDLFGWSHLDLGRRVCEQWRLPGSLLVAFEEDGEVNSLPDLFLRSVAAVERHGFIDPAGAPVPAARAPEREPILDAYYRKHGGTPEGVLAEFRGMLSTARIQHEPALARDRAEDVAAG